MTTAVGYAGTCANDASVVSGDAWSTPSNCVGSGPYGGSAYTDGPSGKDQSNGFKATSFGFSIPSTATIVGISVSVATGWNGVGGTFTNVRAVKGGAIQSTDLASSTTWGGSGVTDTVFGGPSQLWGTTWTYSDINNSGFGVLVAGQGLSNSSAIRVYGFQITVYYTVPSQVVSRRNRGRRVGSRSLA